MKIFRFAKKVLFIGLRILSNFTNFTNANSLLNATPLNCISMKNQECKTRPQVVNVNPILYSFCIKKSKCSGNCNNINYPCAKICVPDIIKNLNVKVFNVMSRTNETRFMEWHETCKCKCRLYAIVWNASNCECECDKSCDIGEYLDYKNCKCRKQLVDKLIDECTETIEEVKLAKITLAEYENKKYSSCTVYIILMIVVFTNFTGITIYFLYYNWSLIKNNVSCIKFGTHKETKIW